MNDPRRSLCLRWKGFRVPKDGNAPEECEDALACRRATGRFAVADGASESGFAGVWAQCLVESFAEGIKPLSNLLATARAKWDRTVRPRATSWHAEAKFEEGAFATFLSLRLGRSKSEQVWRWSARARGDSCLFHVRMNCLLVSFPQQLSSEFDSRPQLLGSRSAFSRVADRLRKVGGDCLPGDLFFLLTDALALWFLTQIEQGRQPWQSLDEIRSRDEFSSWVHARRSDGSLRNDDVAMVSIRVKVKKPFTDPADHL